MRNYCEFIGDGESPWDGSKKGKCKHIGFAHCALLREPIGEDEEGWRTCAVNCPKPYYIKPEEIENAHQLQAERGRYRSAA